MEIVLSFTAVVLLFATAFVMYEIWFNNKQKRQDDYRNRIANFDYDKFNAMND